LFNLKGKWESGKLGKDILMRKLEPPYPQNRVFGGFSFWRSGDPTLKNL
jgi:hypothetical protein